MRQMWVPDLKRSRGPVWLAIADSIDAAVLSGVLRPGQSLPSQRILADFMGLHVNTINRGLKESARRGRTFAAGRRGTFVRGML